jgi:hypothetical protein
MAAQIMGLWDGLLKQSAVSSPNCRIVESPETVVAGTAHVLGALKISDVPGREGRLSRLISPLIPLHFSHVAI